MDFPRMTDADYELNPRLRRVWLAAKAEFDRRYPGRAVIKILEGHRSNDEQRRLYEQGRTRPGPIVTNAKPGQSKHNAWPSRAFDIGVFQNGEYVTSPAVYRDFAAIVKAIDPGISWGGDWTSFKDYPHFEDPTGSSGSDGGRPTPAPTNPVDKARETVTNLDPKMKRLFILGLATVLILYGFSRYRKGA